MLSFIDKLKTNISDKNSNLCVGIDIDKKYFNDNVSLDEMMDYSMMIVDATSDLAAAYKPNLAFLKRTLKVPNFDILNLPSFFKPVLMAKKI